MIKTLYHWLCHMKFEFYYYEIIKAFITFFVTVLARILFLNYRENSQNRIFGGRILTRTSDRIVTANFNCFSFADRKFTTLNVQMSILWTKSKQINIQGWLREDSKNYFEIMFFFIYLIWMIESCERSLIQI